MKAVTMTVRSVQRNEAGEEETMELVTKGMYDTKGDAHVFMYEETELTGMKGTTTTIEIHPHHLLLIRTGQVAQRQEFCLGETHAANYETPFGTLKVSMKTIDYQHDICEGTGQCQLCYEVSLSDVFSHYNELILNVQEEHDGHSATVTGNHSTSGA